MGQKPVGVGNPIQYGDKEVTHIPYPIPEPERSQLIAAGQAACAIQYNTQERSEASAKVRKVIAGIVLRYGYEEGETQ